MPKISVLMPLYNPEEEHLREAITSILNQTFTDFELLIVNDGSKNNAEEVVLSFNDERIRYIKHDNMGLAATLNKGVDLASTNIIARMDQDDIAHSDRLEKQFKFLEENPEISIVGSWIKHFPKTEIVKVPAFPDLMDFLNSCVMNHPTVMFRKSDFLKYDLKYNSELKTSEDYDLWTRAVRILSFANIQEVLLDYRIHGGNMTVTRVNLQHKIECEIKKSLLNHITKNEKIQKDIIKSLNKNYPINMSFKEKMFSIKNKYSFTKKYKILSILGISFPISEKELVK